MIKNRPYISELMEQETNQRHYTNWKVNSLICLHAPTGAGKTTFVLKNLKQLAEQTHSKILILVNRTFSKTQFIEEASKTDIITVKTYQSLEYENSEYDLSQFRYIVCDECHYFLDDSLFNKNTTVSFNKVLQISGNIKIFMSATGDMFFQLLKDIKYNKDRDMFKDIDLSNQQIIEYDFSLRVSENFYPIVIGRKNFKPEVENVINNSIVNNKKVIRFCRSARGSCASYSKFISNFGEKSAIHTASKNNSAYNILTSKSERDGVSEILYNQTLPEKCYVLFTTTALDSGVTIKDKDIKYIIVDKIEDINTLIQCIGRKRLIDGNDKCKVLIRDIKEDTVREIIKEKNEQLLLPKFLLDYGETAFINAFGKGINMYINGSIAPNEVGKRVSNLGKFFYFDFENMSIRLNELAYYKTKKDIELWYDILTNYDSDKRGTHKDFSNYANYLVANVFADEDNVYRFEKFNKIKYERKRLNELLENVYINDIEYSTKDSQRGFATLLGVKNKDYSISVSLSKINDYLQTYQSDYRIVSEFYGWDSNRHKKVSWKIRKLNTSEVNAPNFVKFVMDKKKIQENFKKIGTFFNSSGTKGFCEILSESL